MASSVCGDVGFAAMELEDARDEVAVAPAPKVEAVEAEREALMPPPTPAAADDEDGSWGGWWRSRNRTPEGVRKADMCAAVGG